MSNIEMEELSVNIPIITKNNLYLSFFLLVLGTKSEN